MRRTLFMTLSRCMDQARPLDPGRHRLADALRGERPGISGPARRTDVIGRRSAGRGRTTSAFLCIETRKYLPVKPSFPRTSILRPLSAPKALSTGLRGCPLRTPQARSSRAALRARLDACTAEGEGIPSLVGKRAKHPFRHGPSAGRTRGRHRAWARPVHRMRPRRVLHSATPWFHLETHASAKPPMAAADGSRPTATPDPGGRNARHSSGAFIPLVSCACAARSGSPRAPPRDRRPSSASLRETSRTSWARPRPCSPRPGTWAAPRRPGLCRGS